MEGSEYIAPILSGASDFVSGFFYFLLIAVIVVPILSFIWYKMTYNLKFIVKRPIGNSFMVYNTVGRYKTEEGVTFVELLKRFDGRKIQLKEIPGDAIELDRSGKKVITIVLFTDNAAFEKAHVKEPYQDKNVAFDKSKPQDVPASFSTEYFSTDMQQMLAEQMKKSKKYEQLTVLKALNNHAGLIALVLFVVCLLVFFDNVANPIITVQNTQATIAKQNLETTTKLNQIFQNACLGRQTLQPSGEESLT